MHNVTYELKDNIGIISINNPPVNVLSQSVRLGLKETIEEAQKDSSEALVIECEGRTFIAGADIKEFNKPSLEPLLPEVIQTIEGSSKPVIAALHGTALGGGFEVALACHYRCATPTAKVGLPEVKLGLLPGAGGTQRTPRLAGVKAALDLMLTGVPISAEKAQRVGLIDEVIDANDYKSAVIEYAQSIVNKQLPIRRVKDIKIDAETFERDIFDNYRKQYTKKARNQPAPQYIIDCVQASVTEPFEAGLARERSHFLDCRSSNESAGMRHIFFAERQSAKISNFPKDTKSRDINSVAIIGAGLMGCGIAVNFANASFPVQLLELNQEGLEKGLATVSKIYQDMAKKGRITQEEAQKRTAMISGTTSYADLKETDLVIEAVFESIDVKKQVFSNLDEVCKSGAILATNTSYLDVNQIAQFTSRPQDVVGLHFFSPAHIMKLLEIVRADETADDVLATAMQLARKIKKVPVLSGVCYGFIGNRMLRQYQREVQICLMEGATPEQIDKTMMDWGMAMGPLMVADLSGLDISYKARQALTDEQKGDPKSYRIADTLFEMGRIGQKSGSGYYVYDPETRARSSDPVINDIIDHEAEKMGVKRQPMSDGEILNRISLSLINEGFKILEEGIAQRSSDIDTVYCFGYGFPHYRGGPMFYAETIGLDKVYADICAYKESHGDLYWTPSNLLKTLVEDKATIKSWEARE